MQLNVIRADWYDSPCAGPWFFTTKLDIMVTCEEKQKCYAYSECFMFGIQFLAIHKKM